MSTGPGPRGNRRLLAGMAIVVVSVLLLWDLHAHQVTTLFAGPARTRQAGEPLQLEGMPILRPGTLTLGEGNPTVAVAASIDGELAQTAPIDADLSFAQVDAIVRRALDLDQSGRSIRDVIDPGDWVLIKVNSVTNRGRTDQKGTNRGFFFGGFEHPGQITDLRVVKSVIAYLIEHVGPRKITIAEGGAESPRRGEPGFPSGVTEDAWSVTYPQFDDLSYLSIIEEFRQSGTSTEVDTTDLNYAPWRREPIPGGGLQRLSVTRLTYTGAQFGFHVEGTGSFRTEGFFMPEPILDADKVISIPAMKTTIYGTTLGIKNYVGTLASGAYGDGTSKSQHYQNNPEHGYLDLFAYNPAAYVVIEGFYGTEGDGPQWGLNVQHNVVVAGSDPVATEAVANVTMGFNPLDLEALYLAAAKGYGTLDLRRIRVTGRDPESVRRDFIKSRGSGGNGFFYGRGIRRWLVAGPFDGDDSAAEQLPDEAQLSPLEGGAAGEGAWVKVEHLGYSAEILELGQLNGTAQDKTNYAFALVESNRAQDGFLWFGYDDAAKIWLNGQVVFDGPPGRRLALADQKIPIHLTSGSNRLLFKIGNFAGNTMMVAHVVDEDGDRLPGIEFLLPGEHTGTAVEEVVGGDALPDAAELLGNFPNPFNPATHIRFNLADSGLARVAVYDVAGQRVRELVAGHLTPGYHQVTWDGRDAAGYSAASGIYYAVLDAGGSRQAKPMVLVR